MKIILPFKVKYHKSCIIKTYSITFEVEYGENEEYMCTNWTIAFWAWGYFVTSGYEYN